MGCIEAFEKGQVTEFGMPERVVETAISKLFFFGDRVVKVYKHGEYFFASLANKEARKKFYEDDFFWNQAFSPDIYLKLGKYEDDLYIEMKKIDGSKTLTNLLQQGVVTVDDMSRMTRALVERLRLITTKHPEKIEHQLERTFLATMKEDLQDLRQWLYLGEPHIKKADADSVVELLETAINKEPYFKEGVLGAAIDNNCDNLLFLNGEPSFIDIMTPKENWRALDEYGTVARTAADAYVLGEKELGDAVHTAHRELADPLPPIALLVHEIRGACIQWPYRHMLGQHDVAEKFKNFVLKKVEELDSIMSR